MDDAEFKGLEVRRGGAKIMSHMEDHAPNLSKQVVYSHPDPPTETDGLPSSQSIPTSRRRLNPAFVCWLMGWPDWWTHPELISYAREEMELFLSRARLRLQSLLDGRE